MEDALGVAGMLLQTGRAVHPSKWVDVFIVQGRKAELEGLF